MTGAAKTHSGGTGRNHTLRKTLWVALGVLVCLVWATFLSGASAQEFLPGSEDVPLAPGLSATKKDIVVFDSPGGRIIEAFAAGATDRATVETFYFQTLPALGWQPSDAGTLFHREAERLSIDFFGKDGALTVRFTLAPT